MGSRKEALKALRELHRKSIDMDLTPRELFSPEETVGLAAIERSIPIVAAALLEQTLEQTLISWMPHLSRLEIEQLFAPHRDALLSAFSSKIRISYAMGVISREMRDDLDLIRHIRNIFAHCHGHVDFRTPEIVEICSHFELIKNWVAQSFWLAPVDAMERFRVTASLRMISLMSAEKRPANQAEQYSEKDQPGP